MAKQLTEKQQKFFDVLFDQAGGDIGSAIKLAGYAEGVSPSQMVTALKEEILEEGEAYRVRPMTIHRFAANHGDVTLLEVSTDYPEDVVRLEDDYKRN